MMKSITAYLHVFASVVLLSAHLFAAASSHVVDPAVVLRDTVLQAIENAIAERVQNCANEKIDRVVEQCRRYAQDPDRYFAMPLSRSSAQEKIGLLLNSSFDYSNAVISAKHPDYLVDVLRLAATAFGQTQGTALVIRAVIRQMKLIWNVNHANHLFYDGGTDGVKCSDQGTALSFAYNLNRLDVMRNLLSLGVVPNNPIGLASPVHTIKNLTPKKRKDASMLLARRYFISNPHVVQPLLDARKEAFERAIVKPNVHLGAFLVEYCFENSNKVNAQGSTLLGSYCADEHYYARTNYGFDDQSLRGVKKLLQLGCDSFQQSAMKMYGRDGHVSEVVQTTPYAYVKKLSEDASLRLGQRLTLQKMIAAFEQRDFGFKLLNQQKNNQLSDIGITVS